MDHLGRSSGWVSPEWAYLDPPPATAEDVEEMVAREASRTVTHAAARHDDSEHTDTAGRRRRRDRVWHETRVRVPESRSSGARVILTMGMPS